MSTLGVLTTVVCSRQFQGPQSTSIRQMANSSISESLYSVFSPQFTRENASEQSWFANASHDDITIAPLTTTIDQQSFFKFDTEFFPMLSSSKMGHFLLYSPKLSSTQQILHDGLAKQPPPEFLICLTDVQTQGKGRGGNTWESPLGCLMFSFKNQFSDGNQVPFVQYLVSLAIVKTVKKIVPGHADCVQIKWPNDIYANKVKIAGILCQSEYSNQKFDITTGIGINLSNEAPTTCLNTVLQNISGDQTINISREAFLAEFCNVYEPMQAIFKQEGFDPFTNDYIDCWMHSEQPVTVKGENGEEDMEAIIKGITKTGCLLAVNAHGENFELYPDGNSFDFFSGLLKRKI